MITVNVDIILGTDDDEQAVAIAHALAAIIERDPNVAEVVLGEYANDPPYIVGDQDGVIERFATHDEAAEFIGTLPDAERGIYYIDGPER